MTENKMDQSGGGVTGQISIGQAEALSTARTVLRAAGLEHMLALTATANAGGGTKPVWIRVNQVGAQYGLRRGSLYHLLNSGAIESVSVKVQGSKRGLRLIKVESLERFFASVEGEGCE